MARAGSVGAVLFLGFCALAMADDASRCLDLVQSEHIEAAHAVCQNLDQDDPGDAEVFAFYQQYGLVGPQRLQVIALRGINVATPEERRTLESSREHLLFAAEAGMPNAPMLLAMTIALFEPTTEIDVETGIITYSEEQTYWLRQAAERGWPEANYQLGIRALSDSGTLLIQPEYLPYLERAAELDHAEAAALLRKYESATSAAESAAVDDPDLLREHAIELITHREGDREKGIRLMAMLADAGDEEAMLMVGKRAWREDPAVSRKYLEQAASAGSAAAMMALGNWHACNGNADAAGDWFRKALANEHPEARYALNEMAEWGIDEWECRFL